MAAAQLRAPLYEDKVVDFLFARAEITDRATTREELEAAIEAEEGSSGHVQAGHVHGPDCGHDHDEAGETAVVEPVVTETVKPKKARAKKVVDEVLAEAVAAADAAEAAQAAPKKRTKKAAVEGIVEEGAASDAVTPRKRTTKKSTEA